MASVNTIEAVTVSCLTNAHYHAGREAFLDTFHRWLMFGVIMLGAAAVFDVFPTGKKELIKSLCSAAAAALGALDLVFDLSNRARLHSFAKRQYFDLLAEVREGKINAHQARVCLDRLSSDEEPPFKVLLLSSWNQAQTTVYGRRAKYFDISLLGSLSKNFFRRPGASYPLKEPNPA